MWRWNRKGYQLVFWLLVCGGLCAFFGSFGVCSLQRQEEVQLFIPEWVVIRDLLKIPGGCCTIIAEVLVQYYPFYGFTLFVNSALPCLIGFLCYMLLQAIRPHGLNLLLALFPLAALVKAHLSPFYVLDGTIGLLFLLLFAYGFTRIRREGLRLFYGVISTVVVYGLTGQLVLFYGLTLVVLGFFPRMRWYQAVVPGLIGLLLTCAHIRLAIGIPLLDGIYSQRYQESQMQPDSYQYYIWIRFSCLLLLLLLLRCGMNHLPWHKRPVKIAVPLALFAALSLYTLTCLPSPYERVNHQMDELFRLKDQRAWDAIIQKFQERGIADPVRLSFLNMALAQKGWLADRLFHFNQNGPQGLLPPWDRTYYMSALLSDIHYMLGDISLSEGYAMEGLTLAKRGGSPRMLQRLVEISLWRKEEALVRKYLHILVRMPHYRAWARRYQAYLDDPDNDASSLSNSLQRPDNLLCLIDMDALWIQRLEEPGDHRIVWEYVGCAYLLAKEMGKFKALLERIGNQGWGEPLPTHFQEAVLALAVEDPALLDAMPVQPEIARRFKRFRAEILRLKDAPNGLAGLYQRYGNTFWFYYYCKKLNE